jgi:thiosulfate/3-mercaptopyruvate sulfurtransferase
MDSLVSTEWLADEIGATDLVVVDASYHLPDTGRDALAEYAAGHIPGAVFPNLADLVDPASSLDNTLPPAPLFAARIGALGIGDASRVVLYDDSAIKSAARGWFLFARLFGARQVAVLDGGLGKWRSEGRALATGRESLPEQRFTARSEAARLRTKPEVLAMLAHGREQLVDARGAPRFAAIEQESRPGLASGHIPGSRNVPYKTLFADDGTFRDTAALKAVLEQAGVDLARPVVATCGSGMTACALAFALHLVGKDDVTLYDGSWSEWGADPDTPKAIGPA